MPAYDVLTAKWRRITTTASLMPDSTGALVPVRHNGPAVRIPRGTILDDVTPEELAAFGDLLRLVEPDVAPEGARAPHRELSHEVQDWFARDAAAQTTAEEHAAIVTVQEALAQHQDGTSPAEELAAAEALVREFGLALWAQEECHMAARVDDAGVKTIVDTTMDTTPFITTAHLFVDQRLLNKGLSEDLLTEIERWVAAHFACMIAPRETQKKMGDLDVAYETAKVGEGLASTRYGQQAIALDPSGTLAAASTQRATFGVIGHGHRAHQTWLLALVCLLSLVAPAVAQFDGGVLKRATYDSSTSGDHVVVAGVAGTMIRVYQLKLFCNGANNITVKDSTPATLDPVMSLTANQGMILDANPGIAWYITAAGKDFLLHFSAAQQCTGHLLYTQGSCEPARDGGRGDVTARAAPCALGSRAHR